MPRDFWDGMFVVDWVSLSLLFIMLYDELYFYACVGVCVLIEFEKLALKNLIFWGERNLIIAIQFTVGVVYV